MWFSDNGEIPKKGTRIYIRVPIDNRHKMAFSLAIQDTMNEITRLYNASSGQMVGGISLQDAFKMSDAELRTLGINYQTMADKALSSAPGSIK